MKASYRDEDEALLIAKREITVLRGRILPKLEYYSQDVQN